MYTEQPLRRPLHPPGLQINVLSMKKVYETPFMEACTVYFEENILSGNGSSEPIGYDDDDPFGGGN